MFERLTLEQVKRFREEAIRLAKLELRAYENITPEMMLNAPHQWIPQVPPSWVDWTDEDIRKIWA